ncbi:hypothetical protein F5Y15DRAFT_403202 [Xylariaceae sp. FL0016]|nr:hypothetical protein F5Y15DRAFT_403202 [Xylariaceae sp. FL0016]
MSPSQPPQSTSEERNEVSPVTSNTTGNPDVNHAGEPTTRSPDEPSSRTVEEEAAPPLPKRPARAAHQQPLPQPYHQAQMPYAPYQQTQLQHPYSFTPVRPLPPQTQPYIATKLGLTVLSSVLWIIIIALSCIFISEQGQAETTALFTIPIAVVVIIWNTAELITYCVRLRKETQRGIHPGAHVGLHLIFSLASVLAVWVAATITASVSYDLDYCKEQSSNDDSYSYSYSSYDCDEYEAQSYYRWIYLPILRALLAMLCLATITNFTLFVIACVDTHRRNLLKPAGMIMPVAMPPPGAPGMYYAQPSPPNMPYYQYPMSMGPPQPVHFSPGYMSAPPPGAAIPPSTYGKQPVNNYQGLAGFYAPQMTAVGPTSTPGHAGTSNDLEKRANPQPAS